MTLKRIISDETQCAHCIHAEVCRKTMASWCQNFEKRVGPARSFLGDCSDCKHCDERFPILMLDPIRCFACVQFKSSTGGK